VPDKPQANGKEELPDQDLAVAGASAYRRGAHEDKDRWTQTEVKQYSDSDMRRGFGSFNGVDDEVKEGNSG
jgi:hypothetical protein